MSSDVINTNIQVWRSKVIDGTITQEEMKNAIAAIRKERTGAAVKTAERTATAAAKKKPDGDALLGELMS